MVDRPTHRGNDQRLVSRRIEMYEAPVYHGATKPYHHRPQDSFHVKSPQQLEDSREDLPTSTSIRKENEVVGLSLVESGVRHYSQGEYDKALKAFSTVLKTQRANADEDDLSIAVTLGNLGSVYLQQGSLEEAERALEASLEMKRRLASNVIVADVLNNLGNCANMRGDYEKSLMFYREALEDLFDKCGRRADVANILFNVGRLEIQQRHFDIALEALSEACRLTSEIYGRNHTFVAQTLDLIGFIELSTGDFDAAMASFSTALGINRKNYGPIHIEVANSLFNVGMVREASRELADAWDAYSTARDIYTRLGTSHDFPGFQSVRRSISKVEQEIARQNQRHNDQFPRRHVVQAQAPRNPSF